MFGDNTLKRQTDAHLLGREAQPPDVFFDIKGIRVPAHRQVLKASALSPLLDKLDKANAQRQVDKAKVVIELKLVDLNAFEVMLYYVYNKNLPILNTNETVAVIKLLQLGYECKYGNFINAVLAHLSLPAFAQVLMKGQQLTEAHIYEKMLSYVDEHAQRLIDKEFLQMLNKAVLIDIIKRDTLPVYELHIFQDVMAWGAQQTKEDLQLVLQYIRFTLFQIDELERFVAPKHILAPSQIAQIIEEIRTLHTLPYRYGRTHRTEQDYVLLEGSSTHGYGVDRTSHGAQLFELPNVGSFNYIKLRLDDEFYSAYRIEVSLDQRVWTRIVNYDGFKCFWDQHLYFDCRELRYIHVMPAENVHNFKLHYFHIDYDFVHAPLLIDGFMAPPESLILDTQRARQQQTPQAQIMRFNDISTGRNCYFRDVAITERFWQPRCINCIYIMRQHIGQAVAMIESSVDHEHFQALTLKRDCKQQCFFFETHVACAVRVTLHEKPPTHLHATYISFFYHAGQAALMRQCEVA